MNISISREEPWVNLDIMGKQIQFILDTEAAYSVLSSFSGKPSLDP